MRKTETATLAAATLATPLGTLRIVASPRGVRAIEFAAKRRIGPVDTARRNAGHARRHLARAVRQLREYFAGRRTTFDVPLDLAGSPHQQRVWRALQQIRFGRTVSYGELAARLGSPRAARAVGRACATNPVPVIVPCHRVLDRDGTLHGYGGGLDRKRLLLQLERADIPRA